MMLVGLLAVVASGRVCWCGLILNYSCGLFVFGCVFVFGVVTCGGLLYLVWCG